MTQKAILPNLDQILECFKSIDRMKEVSGVTEKKSSAAILVKAKQVLRQMLEKLIDFIAVYKRADDSA